METLSEGLSGRSYAQPAAGVFPLMNITEDAGHFYLQAELPGVKAGELDISVTGDSISISGERKIIVEDETAKYHRREREAGKFSRIVNLPSLIDMENVEANCVDGILEITLPKSEAAKPRQISVKTE
jgi:HSP20 family protein